MEKPIVLVIMDGVGKGDGGSGDAVKVANTPTLDNLLATCPHTYLKAHGTAVGLPSDEDMQKNAVPWGNGVWLKCALPGVLSSFCATGAWR